MGEPDDGEDDQALVAAMRCGDGAALRAFYDRHCGIVMAIGLRVLGDISDAEELLVDVFHEFWRRVGSFEPARGTPVALLVTLTRSRAIDRRRSRSKIHWVSLPDRPMAAPADGSSGEDEKCLMRQALAGLGESQRRAIECCYYDGLSHIEIAARLQKPLGTIKSWIRQGLLRLREVMDRPAGRRDAP